MDISTLTPDKQAKIRKLALEELLRKNHGSRPVMEQAVPAPYAAPEFTEVSFCSRQDSGVAPQQFPVPFLRKTCSPKTQKSLLFLHYIDLLKIIDKSSIM